MVRYLLVIDISGFSNPLPAFLFQHLRGKSRSRLVITQPADILVDFLCHSAGKHTGIRSGVCCQLLFIKLLHNAQGFIRAYLKVFGTVILKLRKII